MNLKFLLPAMCLLLVLTFVPATRAQSAATSIAGSQWVGDDDEDVTTFSFEKGGILAYSYNGNSYRNGTWSQDGSSISFEMNKHYRSFKGKLAKDTIVGSSENTAGKKWQLTIYRYQQPKCISASFTVGQSCDPEPNRLSPGPPKPRTPVKKKPAQQNK